MTLGAVGQVVVVQFRNGDVDICNVQFAGGCSSGVEGCRGAVVGGGYGESGDNGIGIVILLDIVAEEI